LKRVALFAFRGDAVSFTHVLLNALEMDRKGYEVQIVVEGEATKLIPELAKGKSFLSETFREVIAKDLVAGVCRACATKMQTLKDAEAQNLFLLADMSGHPSMSIFMERQFEIVTI
jgi:hypothetical protein